MPICHGITTHGVPCKCRVKVGKNFCHYHINYQRKLIDWDNEPDTFYPKSIAGLDDFPTTDEIRENIKYKEPSLLFLTRKIQEIFSLHYKPTKQIFLMSELVLVHRELFINNNDLSWINFIKMCSRKFTESKYASELKEYNDNFCKKLDYTYRLEHKKKYIEFICSKSEYKDIITIVTRFM